jgi:hypothetical protein
MSLTASHLLCLAAACFIVGCHKAPPAKTGKAKRDESSVRQSQEREATESFARAIRRVMEWHHAQPLPKGQAEQAAAVQEFSKRLQSVPSKDLPPEILQAWKALRHASQQLATLLASPAPPSPAELKKLKDEGKKAGETLNQWLESQGFGELHF